MSPGFKSWAHQSYSFLYLPPLSFWSVFLVVLFIAKMYSILILFCTESFLTFKTTIVHFKIEFSWLGFCLSHLTLTSGLTTHHPLLAKYTCVKYFPNCWIFERDSVACICMTNGKIMVLGPSFFCGGLCRTALCYCMVLAGLILLLLMLLWFL